MLKHPIIRHLLGAAIAAFLLDLAHVLLGRPRDRSESGFTVFGDEGPM